MTTPYADPYKGAEDLISSLKSDIELMQKARDRAEDEGDYDGDYFHSGQIVATQKAIRGIEVYVLLTKQFQER